MTVTGYEEREITMLVMVVGSIQVVVVVLVL